MNEEKRNESLAHKLNRMASFDHMFDKENLLLGVTVWAKSTGIMLVVNLVASLTGISSILGPYEVMLFVPLGFYLMYRAIASEAKTRYDIPVLNTCWWSFYWRVLMFVLPVLFVLTMMLPDSYATLTPEQMMENPEPLFFMQLAIVVISIIPSGLAASRAILVSYRRIGELVRQSGQVHDDKPDEKAEDTPPSDEK